MTFAATRVPLLAPGTALGGTYIVEAFLGAGSFGQVYRVKHKYLGLQALKIFPESVLGTQTDFFQEARVLVQLTHPNIVRVFEANVVETSHGQMPYLAMEYVDGITLGQLLGQSVRLKLSETRSLARDLAAGLSAAHTLEPPVLHLDLTTGNVLVTGNKGNRQAKIADFGIARQVHPVTRMARAQGTTYFMAPEMFWGYANPSSDVYMLAFLIYWLVAGAPPYPVPRVSSEATADEWAAAVRKSRENPAPPLTRFRLDTPAQVEEVVAKALSPDPNDRFPDAVRFAQALGTAFTSTTPSTLPE